MATALNVFRLESPLVLTVIVYTRKYNNKLLNKQKFLTNCTHWC